MSNENLNAASPPEPKDFIRDIVHEHVAAGKYPKIVTRFPPEPNGYLHIGHAKSICLNFGIAREFSGQCNLRMDDTNPTKEDVEYVDSIIQDVEWLIGGWADDKLGFKPAGKTPEPQTIDGKPDFYLGAVNPKSAPKGEKLETFYASDYFDQLYVWAIELIRKGKAYVCDLSPEDTDRYRGAPDKPGTDSPFRNRSVEESLDLFVRMKKGEFPDGKRTLRAKIDMASPNIWLRDPVLYRIRHTAHHHTGDKWCIYAMYDYAHCLSDYIEGVTHSICTLEFEVHRPLYDWILENLDLPRPLPHQYEFAKLIPTFTIVSKRKLIQLVNDKVVSGWDDPRMPTISGIRRRGVPAEAVRAFAYRRRRHEIQQRDRHGRVRPRHPRGPQQARPAPARRAAPAQGGHHELDPHHYEELDAINNPEDPNAGTRKLPFSRELYIERDDFMETPPPKFFRLRPGGEVRLKYAFIIKCDEVVKDAAGQVIELRCTADLGSKTGGPTAGRKVKGTIHWVSAAHALDAEVRLYDRLFTVPEPDAGGDFKRFSTRTRLEVVTAKCEPAS